MSVRGSVPDPENIELVYDGRCPVCTAYCCHITAHDNVALQLVDARQTTSATMQTITAQGLDIDEGMVLKIGDRLYYGSDAIMMLNNYLAQDTKMGWLNRVLFGKPLRARIFYALGKAIRNGVLQILGIPRIKNLHMPPRHDRTLHN